MGSLLSKLFCIVTTPMVMQLSDIVWFFVVPWLLCY